MSHPISRFAVLLTLLSGAALLSGCGNSQPGYESKAPPPGGPQQSSDMPPGEKAKANNAASPGASSSH